MDKLAIVSVYPGDGIIRGGVEGVSYNLSRALYELTNIEIHVLAPAINKKPGEEVIDGITVHWLPVPKLPGFLSYWTSYRKIIQTTLVKINPDITHFQGVAGWSLWYKRPFVLTIHGINENDVLYSSGSFKYLRYVLVRIIEMFARKRCSDVIVISQYVMNILGNHIKQRSWDIENPVSHDFFEISRYVGKPVVLHVGHINSRKNVINLLYAFKRVLKKIPNAELRLAGPADQEYLNNCREFIESESISENIVFLGAVNRETLFEELGKATCLALVSKQETAPMVIEEAMAAGVPVIGSNLCGIPYMVSDKESGFLVNQNNIDEIADRLVDVLLDEKLCESMSHKCSNIARDRFHASSVANKTLYVYRSVLNNMSWGA